MTPKKLLVAILLCFSIVDLKAQCIHPDCDALRSIYDASNGDQWNNNDGLWFQNNNTNPCNGWFGISCENNEIIRLWLRENGLSGRIHPDIGKLTSIKYLNLGINPNLSGPIPNQITNIRALHTLGVDECSLSGPIPSNIGNLISLEDLSLDANFLTGAIPESITRLSNLHTLRLTSNNLSGCIPDICDIETVEISANPQLPFEGDLNGLCPYSISSQLGAECDDGDSSTFNDQIQEQTCICQGEIDCTDPQTIHPDYNALMALYNSTNGDNWTNTVNGDNQWDQSCDPCEGGWYGIECDSGRVTSVDLRVNNLTGQLPLNFEFPLLRSFDCSDNSLIGSIPDLISVPNLEAFYCTRNSLTGSIPEFMSVPNLEAFYCSRNSLAGSIPDLTSVPKLEEFSCWDNSLTGSIPSLASVPNLLFFYCYNNSLTGSIPDLTSVPNLTSFNCSNNSLTGCLPLDICFLVNEERRNCSSNNDEKEGCQYDFRGNLGLAWSGDFAMACVADTQVGAPCDDADTNTQNDAINENCECQGTDPNQEMDCTDPEIIHPDYNALMALYNSTDGDNWTNTVNGDQPWDQSCDPCDENWYGIRCENRRVIFLDLSVNKLNGSIPEEIGILNELKDLYLSINELRGPIPAELGKLEKLERLWLRSNNLSGSIPKELGDLKNLFTLNLFENQLSGRIPAELSNMMNLRRLLLFENQLSGTIPNELGSLTNLKTIDLSFNNLSGLIPEQLGNLENLEELELNNNSLSGEIPLKLIELRLLKSLYLSNNNLSGCFIDPFSTFCALTPVDASTNEEGLDFQNNPLLPWQGDFSRFCAEDNQIGAPCDDGDPNTQNDSIQEGTCECKGESPLNLCELSDEELYCWVDEQPFLAIACGNSFTEIYRGLLNSQPVIMWYVDDDSETAVDISQYYLFDCNGEIIESCSSHSELQCKSDYNNLESQITNRQNVYTCESETPQCDKSDQGEIVACNLDFEQLICSDFIQNSFQENSWPRCDDENCDFKIYSGSYQGDQVVVLRMDCSNVSENSSVWDIFRCDGTIIEDCFLGLGGNCNIEENTIFSIVTDMKVIYECNSTLPECEMNDCSDITAFNFTSFITRPDCESAMNGGIMINESDIGIFMWSTGDTTSTVSNLSEGTYSLTISDQMMCKDTIVSFDLISLSKIDEACDDANPNTENDIINDDCECRGTLPDEDNMCTDFDPPLMIGDPCDDGNDVTTGDQVNENCECEGTTECGGENGVHPDYAALMDLYFKSNGPTDWRINDGWADGADGTSCDPCDHNGEPWWGVKCSYGRVIGIDLDGNPNGSLDKEKGGNLLSGTLTTAIGDLEELTFLRIIEDDIGGVIPSSIQNLDKLQILVLSGNEFEGEVPAVLGSMSLIQVDLSNNNLSGCYDEALMTMCEKLKLIGTNGSKNGYDFRENGQLPWEGSLSAFCSGEIQIGAACDDGELGEELDRIDENCECVESSESDRLILYNVVSPDRDNINDYLEIYRGAKPLQSGILTVFDRQGRMVYYSEEYTVRSWYGQNMKNDMLPAGVYFYIIETYDGNVGKSSVTILR